MKITRFSGPTPVITIDGPTASGKGTVAQFVAATLGFHLLDSGALYRLTALAAMRHGVAPEDAEGLVKLASDLHMSFWEGHVELDHQDVSHDIRAEEVGNLASAIAVHEPVRAALKARQRAFRKLPGLVADGRDMGTVVFRDAILKVFLTASVEARAERRYKQLIQKGISASMSNLLADLRARDARDSSRTAAPLKPADDAKTLDTSSLSIEDAVAQVVAWYHALTPVSPQGQGHGHEHIARKRQHG
jgi:cytidylate kinase